LSQKRKYNRSNLFSWCTLIVSVNLLSMVSENKDSTHARPGHVGLR
jgi:hypothetical protein